MNFTGVHFSTFPNRKRLAIDKYGCLRHNNKLVVKIRLCRIGAKHRPIYRVVVADSRSPRDGAFIETIGHYNPLTDPASVDINEEKALKWLSYGAQPTDTVRSLLCKLGTMGKFEQQIRGKAAKGS